VERAGDRDFAALDIPKDLIPDFAMAVRSTDEGVAVEDFFRILEVDPVNAQIAFAFPRVPPEFATVREQAASLPPWRTAQSTSLDRTTEGSL
jgi:hypothetical protein